MLGSAFLLGIVAVLGTTISPYLFFWQASSEVDELNKGKAGKSRMANGGAARMRRMRTDIVVGMALSQLVMWAIILTAADELHQHGVTGALTASQAASALEPLAGPSATALFAVGFIGSGLLAIPILSSSAAYAFKEVAGLPASLDDTPGRRPRFFLVITLATVIGVAINLLGFDPIQALFYSAVVNGFVAPPLLAMIVLLGSDRSIMGPATSGRGSRVVTWATVVCMTFAAAALVALTLLG